MKISEIWRDSLTQFSKRLIFEFPSQKTLPSEVHSSNSAQKINPSPESPVSFISTSWRNSGSQIERLPRILGNSTTTPSNTPTQRPPTHSGPPPPPAHLAPEPSASPFKTGILNSVETAQEKRGEKRLNEGVDEKDAKRDVFVGDVSVVKFGLNVGGDGAWLRGRISAKNWRRQEFFHLVIDCWRWNEWWMKIAW